MSTFVYMKLLESAPHRYDLGMRILTLGRIAAAYEAAAEAAVAGRTSPRVLEIGCGTGNLTRSLLDRGARVTAIDFDPEMLAIARAKLGELGERLELLELPAVEIADRFAPASFDAIASCLAFSEMSEDEQAYVLKAAWRLLRPRGRLAIADEAAPSGALARAGAALVRLPIAVLTYLLTQTSTSKLRDLGPRARAAGFRVIEERWIRPVGLLLVAAEKAASAGGEP